MPGLPMVVRETTNLGCNCSHSRSVDQMCRQDPHVRLSSEDAIAAEESLSMYCKPVELYNILQRRALRNPSFLQRCLHYKIQAKHKRRLRAGNVIFNYRYFNNTLQKTEVTVDFSCPFCLVPCASFKGLKYHLISSHDLFNFEFWLTEEYHAVNVSVKTDIWRSEIAVDGVDLKLQTFFFCSKSCRHRRLKNLVKNAKNVHPHVMKVESTEGEDPCTSSFNIPTEASSKDAEPLNVSSLPRSENDSHFDKDNGGKFSRSVFNESLLQLEGHKPDWCPESPCAVEGTEPVASNSNISGVCLATAQASASNESAELASGNNLAILPMLQFAKTKKLSVERAGNRALLQKRQFFHSHRAQPMALDQVLSDKDSEDEVDDAIADFEDRRMLDDFVDVTKVEKQLMHLWNSFVRKQRVLADGHIPWACEAFSRLHGRDLVQTPALIWCWRLFMIKLWNHSLLDARTMNSCNIILESYGNEKTDPMLS